MTPKFCAFFFAFSDRKVVTSDIFAAHLDSYLSCNSNGSIPGAGARAGASIDFARQT